MKRRYVAVDFEHVGRVNVLQNSLIVDILLANYETVTVRRALKGFLVFADLQLQCGLAILGGRPLNRSRLHLLRIFGVEVGVTGHHQRRQLQVIDFRRPGYRVVFAPDANHDVDPAAGFLPLRIRSLFGESFAQANSLCLLKVPE